MSIIAKVKFTNYRQSVTKALDLIDAAEKLPQKGLMYHGLPARGNTARMAVLQSRI